MAENSKIEWCDATFNPWEGCQKVGPGCDHCYAEARDKRFTGGIHWGPGAPRRLTSAANWRKPLKWNADAWKAGTRPRVFCASLADVFDNHASVKHEWREDLWRLIQATPNLDWLLLTKRPQNIAKMLPSFAPWGAGWPNVWLGCTVVNQTEADRDIPKLLSVPAAVHFISAEPLLGPIDLRAVRHGHMTALSCLDWVIAGGESGPNARPAHPDWFRSLRDQCAAAGTAFLFKQWGEWAPGQSVIGDRHREKFGCFNDAGAWCGPPVARRFCASRTVMTRIGKARAGRLLDGVEHNGFPEVRHD